MLTPAKNPWFNFKKTGKSNRQLYFAPGQLLDLLARMPDALSDKLGGELVEADPDIVFTLGGEDAETVLEVLS